MRRGLLFALASIAFASSTFAGAMTWEFRDGTWQQISTPSTQPMAPDPTLDRIDGLLDARQWKVARPLVLDWIKVNPASPSRDRALFLLADVDYQSGDHLRAYYQLDELLENYTESRYFYPALEKQYRIADEYLNGYHDTFLGLKIVSREGEAVEMLYRIQQTSPGSPLAERALLRTADYYYNDLQYDLSADAYGSYIKSYPQSKVLQKVLLRKAFSSLAQFHGVKFDPTPIIDARAQLLDLQRQYPELAAQENLASVVEKIDATFAAKLYSLADYYRRVHEPVGAVYTYRLLIKTYPFSPQADTARAWLTKMPPAALASADPPINGGFIPVGSPADQQVKQ